MAERKKRSKFSCSSSYRNINLMRWVLPPSPHSISLGIMIQHMTLGAHKYSSIGFGYCLTFLSKLSFPRFSKREKPGGAPDSGP
jgi:hypothetical protein